MYSSPNPPVPFTPSTSFAYNSVPSVNDSPPPALTPPATPLANGFFGKRDAILVIPGTFIKGI